MQSSAYRAIVRMGIGLDGRETLDVQINGAAAMALDRCSLSRQRRFAMGPFQSAFAAIDV